VSLVRDRVTLISFCLVPFVVLVGNIIHEGHRASMYLAGVVIVGAFVKNRWIRAFIWYWVAWILLMMVMSLFHKWPMEYTQKSFLITGYMALAFMFFITMQESTLKLDRVFDVICIAAFVQALMAVGQMWDIDPFFRFMRLYANVQKMLANTVTTGALGNNNFMAVYLAISFPFFFRKYWWYCTPVLLAVILVSLTSTATAALMIGCAVFFRDKIKWRWMLLAAIPFVIYLCMIKASLTWNFTWDHDRFHWWRSAIVLGSSTWGSMIFGMGPASTWGKSFPIHNEWITSYFNFGLIGFGIALGYFLTAWRKNRHLYSAFIIAAVTLNGTYPLHLAPTIMLCMIIMGLMEREKHANRIVHNDRAL